MCCVACGLIKEEGQDMCAPASSAKCRYILACVCERATAIAGQDCVHVGTS
jgi:hypothetical protein